MRLRSLRMMHIPYTEIHGDTRKGHRGHSVYLCLRSRPCVRIALPELFSVHLCVSSVTLRVPTLLLQIEELYQIQFFRKIGTRIQAREILKIFDKVGLVVKAAFLRQMGETVFGFVLDEVQHIIETDDARKEFGALAPRVPKICVPGGGGLHTIGNRPVNEIAPMLFSMRSTHWCTVSFFYPRTGCIAFPEKALSTGCVLQYSHADTTWLGQGIARVAPQFGNGQHVCRWLHPPQTTRRAVTRAA